MSSFPCLVGAVTGAGGVRYSLGHRLMDRYLGFVAGRSRPNTLRAVAYDLRAFFAVVAKDPAEVTAVDVFDFLADQRGDRSVVRLAHRESGLSTRTIARRLPSVSSLHAYLIAWGDTRCRSARCGAAWRPAVNAVEVPAPWHTSAAGADGCAVMLASTRSTRPRRPNAVKTTMGRQVRVGSGGSGIGPVGAAAAMAARSPYPPPEVCSLLAARTTGRVLADPAMITPGLAVITPGGRPVNCLRDGVIRHV